MCVSACVSVCVCVCNLSPAAALRTFMYTLPFKILHHSAESEHGDIPELPPFFEFESRRHKLISLLLLQNRGQFLFTISRLLLFILFTLAMSRILRTPKHRCVSTQEDTNTRAHTRTHTRTHTHAHTNRHTASYGAKGPLAIRDISAAATRRQQTI